MAYVLTRLQAYTAASPRAELAATLQHIVDEPAYTFDDPTRKALVQLLLDELARTDGAARLARSDAPLALLAVKTLGKTPAGAEVIARPNNLTLLRTLALAVPAETDAVNEALRCVANTLLLVDTARAAWIAPDVAGGDACVKLLERTTSPEQTFLVARILFLATVSSGSESAQSFIRSLVEDAVSEHGTIVDLVALRLEALATALLAGTKMAKEAITDVLKFAFNLLVHYPKIVDCEKIQELPDDADAKKVMGDHWSNRLNGLLPPLLRLFNTLPATFPSPLAAPLTHVVHALITMPMTPALHPLWFPPATPPSGSSDKGKDKEKDKTSPKTSPKGSPKQRAGSPVSAGTAPRASIDGSGKDAGKSSAGTSAIDRALGMFGRGPRARSPLPPAAGAGAHDTVRRTYDLLEVACAHFLPGEADPDDGDVRARARREADGSLDDVLAPLVVLVTRVCGADEGARARWFAWLWPEGMDRTTALEGRADLLGRCLRLMACVYHERLKTAVGEMLFAICEQDASLLVAQCGYGNVAALLYHKGIMAAPPASDKARAASSSSAGGGPQINPITGTVQQPDTGPEMTDEEKEAEAEKLFVLFDRLERTGAIKPDQNPVRAAMKRGMEQRFEAPGAKTAAEEGADGVGDGDD